MNSAPPEDLAKALGITPASVESRLHAIGVSPADRELLRAAPALPEPQVALFLERFYERLRAQPELAPLLSGEGQLARLKQAQAAYLRELHSAPIDWGYVLRRLRVGAVHYAVRLKPQWYLATYVHLVGEHVPAFLGAPQGVRCLTTLLRSALFDATLALDAYGLSEEIALRAGATLRVAPSARAASDPQAPAPLTAPKERSRAFTQLRPSTEALALRRAFVGLDDPHLALLPTLEGIVTAATPAILRDFYELFTSQAETTRLICPERVDALQRQVASYWRELARGHFDGAYAASRVRVGLVHERIGVNPRWYFTGLARQAAQLMEAIAAHHPAPAAALDAFLRAVFFDAMYVLDAYMEARAETLLRADGYANQLVAGLSSSIAVVDPLGRIASANQGMLDLIGGDAGLIYRAPLSSAIPEPQVLALLERARAQQIPRSEQVLQLRVPFGAPRAQRLLRVTAVLLDPWADIHGRPVALVIEDITALAHIAAQVERREDRFAALSNSVDAMLWELDVPSWTLELVSAQALAVTGYRDVFLLGRRGALLECVAPADRERFRAACEALPPNARETLEHRLVQARGQEVWVRSHLHRPGEGAAITGVSVDITGQRLAEDRARERDQARQHSQAKSQFLAHMSHEIRTPMSGVLGMSRLVLDGELSPDQRESMKMVLSSAEGLLAIINDILDHSKVEAGRMTLENIPFDLRALSEECVRMLQLRAQEKGLALGGELSITARHRQGDPVRLRQVLVNLLGNAIKFTERGAVRLAITQQPDGQVAFVVRDTGVGIPATRLAQIFEPFTQADAATARRFGGTGLGLTISRDLVRLMGGELAVESALGSGSTFRFTIPLPVAPAVASEAAVAEEAPQARLRVLVAEDNEVNARVVTRLLERLGHTVVRVIDGAQAVLTWQEGLFDVVLMDVQMPQLDGLSATRAIRAAEAARGGHTPIVALTAGAMSEDAARCREAGMDDYLSKPIEPRRLQRVLAAACAREPRAL